MRLVMEHLSKQFKNRIAVESIDTELREGVYGFLGANGAGKTTLMQMICGIIEPTAGEVKINGENNIQMGNDLEICWVICHKNLGIHQVLPLMILCYTLLQLKDYLLDSQKKNKRIIKTCEFRKRCR